MRDESSDLHCSSCASDWPAVGCHVSREADANARVYL